MGWKKGSKDRDGKISYSTTGPLAIGIGFERLANHL